MTKTSTLHRSRERTRASPCLTFVDWRGKKSKGIPHPSLGLPEQEWRPRGAALSVRTAATGVKNNGGALCARVRKEKSEDERRRGEEEINSWPKRIGRGKRMGPRCSFYYWPMIQSITTGRHCRPGLDSRVTLKPVLLSLL
jgi:hypothetical protein